MVAGHIQEKQGSYYIVLSYNDENGNRKTKWMATGLAVKGNKKRAEAMLMEARLNFSAEEPITNDDILFSDYMISWLEIIKPNIELTTYASYSESVKEIVKQFKKKASP